MMQPNAGSMLPAHASLTLASAAARSFVVTSIDCFRTAMDFFRSAHVFPWATVKPDPEHLALKSSLAFARSFFAALKSSLAFARSFSAASTPTPAAVDPDVRETCVGPCVVALASFSRRAMTWDCAGAALMASKMTMVWCVLRQTENAPRIRHGLWREHSLCSSVCVTFEQGLGWYVQRPLAAS